MKVSKRIFNLETETAFAVLAKANKLKSQGKDIINLGIGQPDFSTPQNIVEAAIKALKDGHHGYTPSNGIIELREAVSKNINNKYKKNFFHFPLKTFVNFINDFLIFSFLTLSILFLYLLIATFLVFFLFSNGIL